MNRPMLQRQPEGAIERSLEVLLEQVIQAAKLDSSQPRRRSNTPPKPIELDKSEVLLDVEWRGKRYVLIQNIVEAPTKVETVPTRDNLLLSPREQEIARMVMKGYPNKTIAAVLDISVWTVGTHLRRIFSKLGVGNRASMVAHLLEGTHSK